MIEKTKDKDNLIGIEDSLIQQKIRLDLTGLVGKWVGLNNT